jgi:hypothetical protein
MTFYDLVVGLIILLPVIVAIFGTMEKLANYSREYKPEKRKRKNSENTEYRRAKFILTDDGELPGDVPIETLATTPPADSPVRKGLPRPHAEIESHRSTPAEPYILCKYCGTKNPSSNKHCRGCGGWLLLQRRGGKSDAPMPIDVVSGFLQLLRDANKDNDKRS